MTLNVNIIVDNLEKSNFSFGVTSQWQTATTTMQISYLFSALLLVCSAHRAFERARVVELLTKT